MQLELNFYDHSPEEQEFALLHREIKDMHESMGKVRRKIFAEVEEVKKICSRLEQEVEQLKSQLRAVQNENHERLDHDHKITFFDTSQLAL